MFGQKLLIVTLVAGLLLIQLTPMAQAKPAKDRADRNGVQLRAGTRNTGTGTGTNGDDGDDGDTGDVGDGGDSGVDAVLCLIGIANFVIGQINTILPGVLLGVSTCITVCNGGDAAACVACVASAIPAIPTIPTSIAGCG